MTRDDIIRMAREAGLMPAAFCRWSAYSDDLERFAALIAAHEHEILRRDGWRKCAAGQRTTQFCAMVEEAVKAEREACARVCEDTILTTTLADRDYNLGCLDCAAAIRARGEK